MIRAALASADTVVWEWDIDTDRLSDVGAGLRTLGYAQAPHGQTQGDWNRLIHPDDLEANEAAYQRHARGEAEAYEHEYRIRAADGRWRWCRERGRIVERHPDGRPRRMVGIQTDTTEHHAALDEAQRATARLQRLAKHLPGVLYQLVISPEGHPHLRFATERMSRMFGLPEDAAVDEGLALLEAVVPDDRAGLRRRVAVSARSLTVWEQEFRIRRADGSVRWLHGAATPQREADGSTVWHGYMQDVTGRHELDQARRDGAAAAAANRAKTQFLSRMSHELRTPLNAVLGFAQLLELEREPPLNLAQRERVRLIREAGTHLLAMIGDLLDLTRIESGQLALALAPVPLVPLAREALRMVHTAADAAQVQLVLRVLDEEAAAWADRTRLRQVLLNLLSNAIKYNRAGGRVEVTVEPAAPGGTAPEVLLRVSDTGIGIAAEDMATLFEPFERGAQARGSIEGTGIGLSVTRNLVELMRGEILVRSESGIGSTFEVRLPAAA